MEWLLVPAGVLLVLVGLLDIFFTVLHYDGFGFLSSRLYNGLFDAVCLATRRLPRTYRAVGLSMAAPLMVPATITVWIFLVSSGYALVYYAGMDGRTFSSSGLEPSLMEAFYFSGVTIGTLGLGDVTPLNSLYQVIAVSEALIGFGILTLAITYVLGIYQVLRQLGVISAGLYHQAQDSSHPLSILAPHFPGGSTPGPPVAPDGPPPRAHGDLRGHPALPHRLLYFHSRRAYRSLPFAFRMVGGMAGALRWGLPEDHPGSQTPWLPTLITGLETVTTYLDERFLSSHLEETPEPLPLETFEAAISRDKEPADPWLARFLQIEAFMSELAHLEEPPDPKDAYDRYKKWLPFAHRNRAFYEASSRDLGYELEELEGGPGERLF